MKNYLGYSLNIYIFGNKNFKNDIHSLIQHSNLKLRMKDDDHIIEPISVDELKEAILLNPDDIFLIDDSKIIRENSLNKKFSFLKPKDGIEKIFLEENGIGDMDVDSLAALTKYLISKFDYDDETSYNDEDNEAFDFSERDDIQDSIMDIVEEAYNKDDENDTNADKSEESVEETVHLDDELNQLLTRIEKDEDKTSQVSNESPDTNLDELLLSLEKNNENLKEDDTQGALMSNDITFDNLKEEDILAALSGNDVGLDKSEVETISQALKSDGDKMSLNLDNPDDLSKILTQLLNNKTLEITVKVKE